MSNEIIRDILHKYHPNMNVRFCRTKDLFTILRNTNLEMMSGDDANFSNAWLNAVRDEMEARNHG